ncbi:uncharacterized protein C8R40DRAFT_58961 [Lentinula edodes]|uniref:uncharacterized protein n=1 Tax=Lentinula edodes TaxID=5353 RepID=UPI001E8E2486|nr:uncharacterized protein C8R40DRAFT_58961 [Lentinula edodes]KAH7881665.1 hypothetical protein C8R40DRAFT_58961 [Lentinula edodes]
MVHRINSYIAAAFPQLLATTFSSRWRKDFGNLPLETFTHHLSHSSLSRLRLSFKSVPSFIFKYPIVTVVTIVMHINLAYLLFALSSVAHAAPTLPSEKTNLEQRSKSARGEPASSPAPATVYVEIIDHGLNLHPFFDNKREAKVKSIFEEWIRNTKLIKMEKDKAKEGKKATPMKDLPDLPLVPLEIVIKPENAPLWGDFRFWGPGVKDIPGFEKGCETKEDLCRGSAIQGGVLFDKSPPWTDMYYVNLKDGFGVGIKAYRTEVVS